VYSSGEGGAMGMGGPLRSPCYRTIGPKKDQLAQFLCYTLF
jgi:hypothetical protein